MAKKTAPLLPSTDDLLRRLGDRLGLARRRRRLTAKQVAERAGMAPMTLRSLERGGAGVTMGAYLAVMQVLGIEKDIELLAKADPFGRELQDARLSMPSKTRVGAQRQSRSVAADHASPVRDLVERSAPAKRQKASSSLPAEPLSQTAAARSSKSSPANSDKVDWLKKSGFANSEALADLLDLVSPPSRRKR